MRRPHAGRILSAAALTLLAGCGEADPGDGARSQETTQIGHVHGLGVDPADDTLYAATHSGVFRVGEDGSLARVAGRWQDTMAFTVAGPGHFLASGHPDRREDLPTHLGLIESLDAAETWTILSLGGEADLHAIDISGEVTYAYDAVADQILLTRDRRTWTRVGSGPVVDLAAHPGDPERVLVTAPDGTLRSYPPRPAGRTLQEAPPLVLLAWPTEDVLVGVTASGEVHRSEDAGSSWTASGRVPGVPEAFDATVEAWHAATDRGIHRSDDGGRTWTTLVETAH